MKDYIGFLKTGISVLMVSALSACSSSAASIPSEGQAKPKKPAESEIQKDARISYLGPAGTYTEEAAKFFFSDGKEFMPQETVIDAIEMMKNSQADYAVIPQENTIGGAVVNYVDALIGEENVYVVGEVILPISQTLMGIEGTKISDIKTVYSHAQGLSQSEEWRKENMPQAVTEETSSTAAAAEYVSKQNDKTIAAIASPGAAELYGLSVLAENVQISDANKTRFYVLAKDMLSEGNYHRAVFTVKCDAEMIDDIIVSIHDAGLEMVTIHDRPQGTALGSYNYIIEVSDEDGISMEEISQITENRAVHYCGTYDMKEKKNQ